MVRITFCVSQGVAACTVLYQISITCNIEDGALPDRPDVLLSAEPATVDGKAGIVLETPLIQQKSEMRARVIARRDAVPSDEHGRRSGDLCWRLLEFTRSRVRPGAMVAAFYPLGSEVDIRPYLSAVLGAGYRLALPVMEKAAAGADSEGAAPARRAVMAFVEVGAPVLAAADAPFLSHPARSVDPASRDLAPFRKVAAEEVDMAVVPLVAFDSRFARLGYGGGNYDAFLGRLREDASVVGVAFEEQRVDRVPLEPHDLPLPDILVG